MAFDTAGQGFVPFVGSISPKFSRFFDQLKRVAGDKDVKFIGGESPLGSNQFRGIKPGVLGGRQSELEGEVALENRFARRGLMGEAGLRDELVRSQGGSSRQAFEALMRALKERG